MKKKRGPTKRMIPCTSRENACPHRYSDDDGIQLEVDCGGCLGPQDLNNAKCMTGILNIIVESAVPEAIILRRSIHKRFRGDAVDTVLSTAQHLSRINRVLASHEVPSDKRCRTCPASIGQVAAELRRSLLRDPVACARRRFLEDGGLDSSFATVDCGDRDRCAAKAIDLCHFVTDGR